LSKKQKIVLKCTKCDFEDELIQGVFAKCPKCGGSLRLNEEKSVL